MFDLTLAGPWPRTLTPDEIDDIKARAMISIGDLVMQKLPGMPVFNLGESLNLTYTVSFGTSAEIQEAKKYKCGATPPNGGPACGLDKGHTCDHSSVVRWK